MTTPRSSELSGVRRADAEPGSGEFVIDFSGLTLTENLLRLIANEKEEFEAVLGRKVDFRTASDVRVGGSVSGGGSGRPRRVPLLPGVDLTISTAITHDRQGNPVEFRGIRPDVA
ncbi:hypothetical protein AB0O65_02920 [Microbacterium sp. NPDC077391]|uniref:hypothetical protein n=1 Tax=Microbacterium sp. NPDC077391 TaxID=3154765 RepID=UPI00343198B1